MKPKWLVSLGICIAVASLLLSCSPASPIVPVTGRDSQSVPDSIVAARNLASTHIESNYATLIEKEAMPALPSMDTWKANTPARPDLVDMSLYAFTSGDWLVTIRRPANSHTASSVTYINTKSGFVWAGYVDPDGNVVDVEYSR